MTGIDLKDWQAFCEIARQGGFTKAAEALGENQPNLSRRIALLEQRLGVQLFERHARGTSLTSDGADLLASAKDLLARHDRLVEHAQRLAGAESGTLRLGASTQSLESFVAPFVGRFLRLHPGIDVSLVEGQADEVIELLASGQIDFGVVASVVTYPLQALPLFTSEIQLFTTSSSSYRRKVELKELHGQPLLLPSRSFVTRRRFDELCAHAQVVPTVRLESESAGALLALVEEGYGVAVLPSTVAIGRPRKVFRVALLVEGRKVAVAMNLIWNSEAYQSAAAQMLREELIAFAKGRL